MSTSEPSVRLPVHEVRCGRGQNQAPSAPHQNWIPHRRIVNTSTISVSNRGTKGPRKRPSYVYHLCQDLLARPKRVYRFREYRRGREDKRAELIALPLRILTCCGARVALQRCPILRPGEATLSQREHFGETDLPQTRMIAAKLIPNEPSAHARVEITKMCAP
jgi:hypothetical protein